MASSDYPRDLVGYGANPPRADWPGGARIAVQFVLNYEEGGENCVLHGDAGSEQFLSEIVGAASYPARHMSMESIYEYGSRVGAWRILREFGRRGLPLTVFGVAMALQRNPEFTRACVEADLEGRILRWARPVSLPGPFAKIQVPWRQFVEAGRSWGRNVWRFMRADLQYFAGMNRLFTEFYDAIAKGSSSPTSPAHIRQVATIMDDVFAACREHDRPGAGRDGA